MKKAIWFVLGCLLIGGAAFGQSFTITSPNGGESWANSSVRNLDWTVSPAVSVGAFKGWLVDGVGNWVPVPGALDRERSRPRRLPAGGLLPSRCRRLGRVARERL